MKKEIYLKANKLFKRVRKFILCGIDDDGYPTAKAVLSSKNRDKLDVIYFVTNTDSKYVRQIEKNNKTSVYFFSSILYKGCLLKGKMEVVSDVSIKKSLWKNSYKSAYPNPKLKHEDPDFCVLKFTTRNGRYYSMFKTSDFEIK